jgi:hypothetical protein
MFQSYCLTLFGTLQPLLVVIEAMNKNCLLFLLPLASAIALPATAQFGPSKVAAAHASVQAASVVRGGKDVLIVTLNVKPQYHVNANKPNDPAYIPTVFTPAPVLGVVFGPVHYPSAKLVKVSYSTKPLLVYTGKAVITVLFTVAKTAKPGPKMLTGSVAFQGCDAKSCYPPATAPVKAALTVK